MYKSSLISMTDFIQKYLKGKTQLKVLFVDSQDFCDSYRHLFVENNHKCFDIISGKNIDIANLENIFDVVISGQNFEHIEDVEAVMKEVYRVMKWNAICCIIVPSTNPQHLQYYKIYKPIDFIDLANKVGLTTIEAKIGVEEKIGTSGISEWDDCIFIGRKYEKSFN